MEELTEISLRERIRLNLVFAMEKANINQVNLADKLGISKGTVNNWVRGNNSPDVDMVPKICKVLNISVLDLYSSARFEPGNNGENAHTNLDESDIVSKKSPGAAEAEPGEDAIKLYNYINQGLVSLGFIGEDDDITPQQAEILIGICRIIKASFDQ